MSGTAEKSSAVLTNILKSMKKHAGSGKTPTGSRSNRQTWIKEPFMDRINDEKDRRIRE